MHGGGRGLRPVLPRDQRIPAPVRRRRHRPHRPHPAAAGRRRLLPPRDDPPARRRDDRHDPADAATGPRPKPRSFWSPWPSPLRSWRRAASRRIWNAQGFIPGPGSSTTPSPPHTPTSPFLQRRAAAEIEQIATVARSPTERRSSRCWRPNPSAKPAWQISRSPSPSRPDMRGKRGRAARNGRASPVPFMYLQLASLLSASGSRRSNSDHFLRALADRPGAGLIHRTQ